MIVAQNLNIPVFLVISGFVGKQTPNYKYSLIRSRNNFKRLINIYQRYRFLGNTFYRIQLFKNKKLSLLKSVKYVFFDVIKSILIPELRGNYNPDYIFVFNLKDRHFIKTNNNYPENKLFLFKHPKWDNIHHKRNNLSNIKNNYDANRISNIITILTTADLEHELVNNSQKIESLQSMKYVMNAFKNNYYFIKPHPNQNVSILRKIFDDMKDNVIIFDQHYDLHKSIMNADIVIIVNYSTTIIDATLLDKYSIIYNPFNYQETIPCVSFGVSLEATNSNELIEAIQIIQDENSKFRKNWTRNKEKFLPLHCANWNGPNSNNIMSIISKLLL